jgi:hypothetical protein
MGSGNAIANVDRLWDQLRQPRRRGDAADPLHPDPAASNRLRVAAEPTSQHKLHTQASRA